MQFFRRKRGGEPAQGQGTGGREATASPPTDHATGEERPAVRRRIPVAPQEPGATGQATPSVPGAVPGKRSLPMAGGGAVPGGVPVVRGGPPPGTPRPGEGEGAFQDAVRRAAATIVEPETGRPFAELGLIRSLDFAGRVVKITVELTAPEGPEQARVGDDFRMAIGQVPGVERVDVTLVPQTRSTAPPTVQPGLSAVKYIVAIASGKGGVGKSTVAVNLAVALAREGARVGLLDACVYGPSLPLMLNLQGPQPRVHTIPSPVPGERPTQRLLPLDAHGIAVMSIGFLLDPEKPVIWRGPMASQLIQQFINDVEWGELDYVLIDLPPGTGDIQLTLTQRLPLSGAIIVTTPQDVALADAVKGLQMFREVQVPVLGIIENMSYFVCPNCGEPTAIFGQGGGKWASQRHDVPLLGQIPLDPTIREGGDAGQPIVSAHPESPQAVAFQQAARAAADRLRLDEELRRGTRPSGPLIQIQRRKPGQ